MGPGKVNPNGVAAWHKARRAQPRWGWGLVVQFTQGSSRLATLGFVAESLWDSTEAISAWVLEWACGAGRFATGEVSAGVRAKAWLTRVRSRFKVSAARSRAGGDGARVFATQRVDSGGAHRSCLAADASYVKQP
jgi:hypothetical protein